MMVLCNQRLLFIPGKLVLLFLILFSMNTHAEVQDPYAKGMHVVITGVGGGAQSALSGGAGAAVIIDGKLLQFDAGPKTQENLIRSNVLPRHKIDYLFFTHLHVDHTSDFVYMRGWPGLIFNKGYKIYGPQSTKAMSDAAADFNILHYEEMDALALKWPHTESFVAAKALRFPPVTEIPPSGGVVLHTDYVKVTAQITPHMMSEKGYSLAYRVDSRYGSLVISGDTVPNLNIAGLAENADLLIHEAVHESGVAPNLFVKFGESAENLKTDDKATNTASTEVGKVAQRAHVKTLVTYHHQGTDSDDSPGCQNNAPAKKDMTKDNDFIATIRQDYDGEIVIGRPCMVFTFSQSQEN